MRSLQTVDLISMINSQPNPSCRPAHVTSLAVVPEQERFLLRKKVSELPEVQEARNNSIKQQTMAQLLTAAKWRPLPPQWL